MTSSVAASVAAIHLHPVKSCRRVEVERAIVGPFGLEGDREWQVQGPEGQMMNQRKFPSLARVQPVPVDGGLRLQYDGMPDLLVDRPTRSDCRGKLPSSTAIIANTKKRRAVMADNLVELYKRAIEAFNGNDLETTAELVADNVVYTFHGDHPAAGRYDGHEGFREVLRRAKELTGGTASFEPLAVVTNDEDTLMVWGIFRGERNGTTFETHHAYYYRFEDGQIVEGHTIPADQTAANAFWSS